MRKHRKPIDHHNRKYFQSSELAKVISHCQSETPKFFARHGIKPLRVIVYPSGYSRKLWGRDAYELAKKFAEEKAAKTIKAVDTAPEPIPEPTPTPEPVVAQQTQTQEQYVIAAIPLRLRLLSHKIDVVEKKIDSLIAMFGNMDAVVGHGFDDERAGA